MAETSKQDIRNIGGDAALARPYARAVFELAKRKDDYRDGPIMLALMAAVVSNRHHAVTAG